MKAFAFPLWAAAVAVLSFTMGSQAQTHKATNHEKVLYTFTGENDGAIPQGTLIRDSEGNLYGTTYAGGDSCYYGTCGVIFKLSAAGEFSVLHTFEGNDQTAPASPNTLVRDTKGNLYGTTLYGGDYQCYPNDQVNCGVIFEISTTGVFTVLYNFTGPDGGTPLALTIDPTGNLYGGSLFTKSGYGNYGGQVFEFTTAGELKVLYNDFTNSPDSIVRDSKGNLYGTVQDTGSTNLGIVFKLTPNNKESILHTFKGKGDGYSPAALALDAAGNLYGVASSGGNEALCQSEFSVGCGTAFKITTKGTFSVLLVFNNTDGSSPNGLTVGPKGNVYGTAGSGGTYNAGLVFKLAAGNYKNSVLYEFTGQSDGGSPSGGLVEDSNYNLYGNTGQGGDMSCQLTNGIGCGVVFEITAH
jgi:uncharacterized repeat protein (TIGR03803 family)